jgi:iron complex outermembrane recepter protein
VEAGLKWARAKYFFGLNAFWMKYRNQLALNGQINNVGAYTRINIPDSYRAGMELEFSLQALKNWHFQGNMAMSRNKIRRFTEYRDNWDTGLQESFNFKNTDLAFSPSWVAYGEITYDILKSGAKNALSCTFSGKYVGKQYLDNTSNEQAALDPYAYFNLSLNYSSPKIARGRLHLIATVNNLFNAQYESNGWVYRYTSNAYDARLDNPYTQLEKGSVYNQTGLFPQAGRHWMLTIRLEGFESSRN